ncbi:MAG TPA: YceI family protein [Williamwhitmania sp.]|nr:YceI family protein [Williamwhitmania sp.]
MFINILAAVFWLFNINSTTEARLQYHIVEPSRLTIAGSSNVNNFECTSSSNFNDGSAIIVSHENGRSLQFSNASINLKIKSFDCKNNLLNRDFYRTLNADTNPTIRIELQQIETSSTATSGKWNKFKSKVTITLNKVSKDINLDLSGCQYQVGDYHVCGSTELHMSDFGIKPPTTMLGLIQVENKITIDFDLFLQTSPTIQ